MRYIMVVIMCILVCSVVLAEDAPVVVEKLKEMEPAKMEKKAVNTIVEMKTSLGSITIELNDEKAPVTVENFLKYVDDDFYSGTIFHRVIKTFMIQGGGFTKEFGRKPVRAPIKNEAGNGLKNERGTIAMARTGEINSATSQFFINVVDNYSLNHRNDFPAGFGYCVFGKVIDGMDVVDKIRYTDTGSGGPFPTDVPQQTVEILGVSRVSE